MTAEPLGDNAQARLRGLVERIERLDDERRERAADIADVFREAKSAGFDPKVLRQLIRERRRNAADVEEEAEILRLYREVLS